MRTSVERTSGAFRREVHGKMQKMECAAESVPVAPAKSLRLARRLCEVSGMHGSHPRLQPVAWTLLSNGVKLTPTKGRKVARVLLAGGRAELLGADNVVGMDTGFVGSDSSLCTTARTFNF